MIKQKIKINEIPTVIWGEKQDKVYIAVHGSMSNKEDTVIGMFAKEATLKGYQVLSFDLPEHGDRKENKEYLCKVQNCVKDLKDIIEYAKNNYKEINVFACSMGAYFSLLAYKDENINKAVFLSPIVNMKVLIENMMMWANVTEEMLIEKKEIQTSFGQTLYLDYYEYVKQNPVIKWNSETYILYGTKDNMQDMNLILDFKNKFNVSLKILENGEHYFHTNEQLNYYKNWLENII